MVGRHWIASVRSRRRCNIAGGILCLRRLRRLLRRAWLMMVSIQMVVFPVDRSPMINSRWRADRDHRVDGMMPVCTGCRTGLRRMMPGASFSTG